MLVVSDSSPINFLIRLHCIDVLPKVYGSVLVPPTVIEELSRPNTPLEIQQYLANKPVWLEVRSPSVVEYIPKLDPGEIAAISLARELHADFIFLDDRDAREAASKRGLAVTGLLGILERADLQGLVCLPEIASRLPQDYRIDKAILDAAVQRCALRSATIIPRPATPGAETPGKD